MAILVKSALFLHFFWFEDDKFFQSIAAQNLALRNGLVYHDVHVNNPHEVIKVPLNRWPMGYSVGIFVLYKITGNLIASTLLFDLIFIFLFLLVLKKILQELKFPLYLINILTLFNGFLITIHLGQPTDLPAATLVLVSIFYTLRFYESESSPSRRGILIGILSFLPSFLRYMYIPSTVVAGGVLLFAGIAKKDKRLILGAIYSLSITIILTMGLLAFNKIHAGSSTYIMPMEKGIYPLNMFKLYPFLYGSFINIDLICTQLELLTRFDYTFWFNIFVYTNLIICGFLFLRFPVLANFQSMKKLSSWNLFVLVSASIVTAIILLTGYLSLTNSGYRISLRKVEFWTFINDGRYFTFAMIVVPIILTRYLFVTTSIKKLYFFKYLFLFLLIFEIFHTSRFLINKFKWTSGITNATLPIELKEYLIKRIAQLKEQKLDVVVTGYSENVANWGFLNGAKGLVNIDKILGNVPKIDSTTVFLLVIKKDEDKQIYDHFLKQSGSRFDSMIGQFAVYSYQSKRSE